jgi:DNA-binding response OmpR family regulator
LRREPFSFTISRGVSPVTTQARILVCEDEPDIAEILRSFLSAQGYVVTTTSTAAEALAQFAEKEPDLVLLDVMLPDKDGWQVLAEIRQKSDRPVILLTALGRVEDRVRGLSHGADDYIPKPFHLDEVRARIEAVLRRSRPSLTAAGIWIDDARKEVRVRGKALPLSPKEYGLLKLLASAPGRVFSTEEILAQLWPASPYSSAQDVQKYAYLLRKKLEEDPAHPKLLLTVRGFGYRLAE